MPCLLLLTISLPKGHGVCLAGSKSSSPACFESLGSRGSSFSRSFNYWNIILSVLSFIYRATMDSPRNSPNPSPHEAEVRSDPGLDRKASVRSTAAKRGRELTRKGGRDARVTPINTDAGHSAPSHRQEEELSSPLRLALARRSVKRKIFTYMDQGDKKTDIESRTGLSHRFVKWHRQLWRTECSHPRPLSKKLPQGSSRRSQSPSKRDQRSSRKRPACERKDDSSDASECSSGKRRRKKRVVKQSIGRSVHAVPEMSDSRGGKCAESEVKGPRCFAGKENVPGKDEAMVVSVLPIRELVP